MVPRAEPLRVFLSMKWLSFEGRRGLPRTFLFVFFFKSSGLNFWYRIPYARPPVGKFPLLRGASMRGVLAGSWGEAERAVEEGRREEIIWGTFRGGVRG